MPPPPFFFQEPYPHGADVTPYHRLTEEFVSVGTFEGVPILKVEPAGLTFLAERAFRDVSFLLRAAHLGQVAAILDDPLASKNDRTVALTLLRNAEVSAHGVLPFCQDTGTASVVAKKGQHVWTAGGDAEAISRGIYNAYTGANLRYSQMAPLSMYEEVNTGTNLPAQIEIAATDGSDFEFLFVAKGGGSANKMSLFQKTKALLNPASLEKFLIEQMLTLGTSACPPYHIAFVIGGTSAEACLKTVKLATTKSLDDLPIHGTASGQAFRDIALEQKILAAAQSCGIGAQFGGKYFALDVRIIRLPRHGASCPVGMGVSCSADRNIKARIDREGIWLETLEVNPGRFIPDTFRKASAQESLAIDLNRPMPEILAELSRYPITTQLRLTGTIVVARDLAHANLKDRLDRGEKLPQYLRDHPVYYAGPAKTPKGLPSGSFGPTTAGRMDDYVELFQSQGASLIMIAKGNRSQQVTDSCHRHGGFYLGSIGGPAAILAKENIRHVEVLECPELGMEAIWKIDVVDFPAFILVDNKGNDFFEQIKPCEDCAVGEGS